jgi:glycerophosphoryl diester phosphodiesterase
MKDMKRLLELGVDGIITDHPDQLISLLSDMKGRP